MEKYNTPKILIELIEFNDICAVSSSDENIDFKNDIFINEDF